MCGTPRLGRGCRSPARINGIAGAVMHLLLLDDHLLFLDGLRSVLADRMPGSDIDLCRTATEALSRLQSAPGIDLALVDLHMPGTSGIALLRLLAAHGIDTPVAVLSASEDALMIAAALDAGAVGYIPKHFDTDHMVAALDAIMRNGEFIPAEFAASLHDARRASAHGLSARQLDVLDLLARGLTNRRIGEQLGISEHTVKSHVRALLSATGAGNRAECAARARERGWLPERL